MQVNLKELLEAKIEALGGVDAAADFFGETSALMKKVRQGKALNFNIVEKLLAELPDPAPPTPPEDNPNGDTKALNVLEGLDVNGGATGPESVSQSMLSPEVEAELEELRGKLRVNEGAGVEEILNAINGGRWNREMTLLFPSTGIVGVHTMFNVLAMMKKCPWLGFFYKANTTIQRARNVLAQRFLASEAQWSLWMDSDMILPFNDPGFYRERLHVRNVPVEFAKIMTPDRLRRHGRTIVGGVYAMREIGQDGKTRLCIQPELAPRGAEDKDLVERLHRGPFNEVVEVGFIATGCALVHRKVYTDIQEKFPELAPKREGEPWDFFGNDVGRQGEDMHFCRLAREAGHRSFLDCGVFAGHIGNYAFMP